MHCQESPIEGNSGHTDSADLTSSEEGDPSEQTTPRKWDSKSIEPIDMRLSKILERAYAYLVMQKEADPGAAINELTLLGEKINFLKNNKREFDLRIEMLCYYNIACAFQAIAFSKSDITAIEECIKKISKASLLSKEILKEAPNQYFKIALFQVKMNLQFCALLSQMNQHEEAYRISKQTIGLMKSVFENGLVVCLTHLNEVKTDEDESVSFARAVLAQAKQSLMELTKFRSFEEVIEADHQQLQSLKEKNYFWKKNYENNERTLRKGLQIESQEDQGDRNILGIKVKNDWMNEFTIGKVMHMKPYRYEDFLQHDNIVLEFNYRSIVEKVILASVAYFSIATQMRFMENDFNAKNVKEIKKSEIFHLKAIETACKYIKGDSIFVDHLISSYHRHYLNDLIIIDEEPSFAEQSLLSINDKRETFNIKNRSSSRDYFTEFNEILEQEPHKPEPKGQLKSERNSMFIFKKNKNNLDLLQSIDLEAEDHIKTERLGKCSKEMNLKKLRKDKLEKSSSILKYNSMKAEKHSSTKPKDNTTIKVSRSPEPSMKLAPNNEGNKIKMKKKSRRLITQR